MSVGDPYHVGLHWCQIWSPYYTVVDFVPLIGKWNIVCSIIEECSMHMSTEVNVSQGL